MTTETKRAPALVRSREYAGDECAHCGAMLKSGVDLAWDSDVGTFCTKKHAAIYVANREALAEHTPRHAVGRGGRRPGAGRKPSPTTRHRAVTVRFADADYAELTACAERVGMSLGEYIADRMRDSLSL